MTKHDYNINITSTIVRGSGGSPGIGSSGGGGRAKGWPAKLSGAEMGGNLAMGGTTIREVQKYQKQGFKNLKKQESIFDGMKMFLGVGKGMGGSAGKGMGMMAGVVSKGGGGAGAMGGIGGALAGILGVLMQSKVFLASIETVLDVIGSFTDIAMVAALILIEKIPALINSALVYLSELPGKFIKGFMDGVRWWIDAVDNLGSTIGGFFTNMGNTLQSSVNDMWNIIGGSLKTLWDNSLFGQGVAAFVAFTQDPTSGLNSIASKVSGAFTDIKGYFSGWINDGVSGLKSWGGVVAKVFSPVTDLIKTWTGIDIPGYFSKAFSSLTDPKGAISKLSGVFNSIFTSSTILSVGFNMITGAAHSIYNAFKGLWNYINSIIPGNILGNFDADIAAAENILHW